jgi:mono/diheme cytochrome c family protein
MTLQLRFRLSVAVLCTVLIASALIVLSEAQSKETWSAPAAETQKKNPIAPTQESIAAGQKIYSKTCAMCHGKTGDADGPAVIELNIHPAKLSDPQLATESDGALFWKITTGKKPMPAYGKRLSETDRWHLVNYVRILSKR